MFNFLIIFSKTFLGFFFLLGIIDTKVDQSV